MESVIRKLQVISRALVLARLFTTATQRSLTAVSAGIQIFNRVKGKAHVLPPLTPAKSPVAATLSLAPCHFAFLLPAFSGFEWT